MTLAAEHVIPVDYDDDDHLDAAWLNVFEQRIDDIRTGRVALVGREEGNAQIPGPAILVILRVVAESRECTNE